MSDPAIETQSSSARADDSYTAHALARVREALSGLRYGEVTVIVQDGVVVQVERTEKLRLQKGRG
ncbi:MAG TPA: YezD family protein [Candidatus Binatia bacterium]|nr:YezD family protein [Candidatus Binatia bacterium]